MPAHPIDYEINANVFSTPELLAIFDEKARYERWLRFEAALAKAQGELGIIPTEAAEEIERNARLECLDLESVRVGYTRSRNSIVPLINGLRKACNKGGSEYVHHGATTQDVIDTGESLELKETLTIIYRDLRALEGTCLELVKRHRATPTVARTHGQQALPTTFGLKAAVWLSEIRRHIERIKAVFPSVNIGQLGGAVGTMAALGPQAVEVAKRTMAALGLRHRVLAWHNSRDHVGETACVFTLLVTTLAKIANEIFQLQKTEIGELAEPALKAVASSTMPHKTNPVICQRIVVLSRHVRHLSATILESMAHEHERDARCLWAEWLAVPELCIYTGTALDYTLRVMADLDVRTDRMMANLSIQKTMVASEWLLFRLSSSLGKMKALETLHALSSQARESGMSLRELIENDPEVGSALTPEDLIILDQPERYIGQALEIVDQVVEEIETRRRGDLEKLG
jgi:3-carboxy-cis,cis-muconate cycloisomerase